MAVTNAQKDVPLKQEFQDKERSNITIFETFFCDVPGKKDCKYSHGCVEQFLAKFTLQPGFLA
ncbi:hypothetical protein MXB_3498, partial [Myxobolus squamalis]